MLLGARVTADVLRALIADSGLSQQAFAYDVAGRDPRTVTQWMASDATSESADQCIERLRSVVATDASVTIVVSR